MVSNQQLNEELRQLVIKAQQHPANTKMRQMKRRFIDAINETFSSFVKPSNCCNKRLGNENLEQLVVSPGFLTTIAQRLIQPGSTVE